MSDEFRREQERQTKSWDSSIKSIGDHYNNPSSQYADYNPYNEKDKRRTKWLLGIFVGTIVVTIVWFIIMASG